MVVWEGDLNLWQLAREGTRAAPTPRQRLGGARPWRYRATTSRPLATVAAPDEGAHDVDARRQSRRIHRERVRARGERAAGDDRHLAAPGVEDADPHLRLWRRRATSRTVAAPEAGFGSTLKRAPEAAGGSASAATGIGAAVRNDPFTTSPELCGATTINRPAPSSSASRTTSDVRATGARPTSDHVPPASSERHTCPRGITASTDRGCPTGPSHTSSPRPPIPSCTSGSGTSALHVSPPSSECVTFSYGSVASVTTAKSRGRPSGPSPSTISPHPYRARAQSELGRKLSPPSSEYAIPLMPPWSDAAGVWAPRDRGDGPHRDGFVAEEGGVVDRGMEPPPPVRAVGEAASVDVGLGDEDAAARERETKRSDVEEVLVRGRDHLLPRLPPVGGAFNPAVDVGEEGVGGAEEDEGVGDAVDGRGVVPDVARPRRRRRTCWGSRG